MKTATKTVAKKFVRKPAAKRTPKVAKVETISLASIAKGVNVSPKVARNKFRRLIKAGKLTVTPVALHTYAVADKAKVVAILTGSK
jgi:hypothetical protein